MSLRYPSAGTRWLSTAALIGLAALLAIGLGYLDRLDPRQFAVAGLNDSALHTATVQRLAAGDPYYTAVGSELRQRGYPSASVPNWRTPLHYQVVARLGIRVASWVIITLACLAVIAGAIALHPTFQFGGLVGLVLLIGTMLPVWLSPEGAAVFAENWSGVLIAISLAGYHIRGHTLAATVLIVALFIRELVAPLALVCALCAFISRRRSESMVWIVGGVLYALYYSLHASAATNAMSPDAWAWNESWVRWLGWSFVLQTVWTSGWTIVLPGFFTPLVATLSLAGTAARSMPPQLRGALLLYAGLFCAVGQEFNFYWGWVTAPFWAYGLMYAPEGLTSLLRGAFGRAPL